VFPVKNATGNGYRGHFRRRQEARVSAIMAGSGAARKSLIDLLFLYHGHVVNFYRFSLIPGFIDKVLLFYFNRKS
jgi:hypothetical protein